MGKQENLARYTRRYQRHRPALKAAPKGPARRHESVGGRYSIHLLRDCFISVSPFTGGGEYALARRSPEFRFKPSRNKYKHNFAKGEAKRVERLAARAAL